MTQYTIPNVSIKKCFTSYIGWIFGYKKLWAKNSSVDISEVFHSSSSFLPFITMTFTHQKFKICEPPLKYRILGLRINYLKHNYRYSLHAWNLSDT